MSNTSDSIISGSPPPIEIEKGEFGKLGEKSVTKNPSPKCWFVLAIIIGSIAVIGVGGFGTAGLLQSYGVISLPQSVASAFTIGPIPLWIMTAAGAVIGGSLIGFGAHKIHKIKAQEIFQKTMKEFKIKLIALEMSTFKLGSFIKLGVSPMPYRTKLNENNTYITQCLGKREGEGSKQKFVPEERLDRYFIVIKDSSGKVLCTNRITKERADSLKQFLQSQGFRSK